MTREPRSLQSWVSTIQTVVLTADVFQLFIKNATNQPDVPRGSFQSLVSTIQPGELTAGAFHKKLKNVSCEYDRLNGWNSTLQAAWYIRHVRIIWFLWTKPTIWLLILSFTQNIVRACSMFCPYEGYRSVTPLDDARPYLNNGTLYAPRYEEAFLPWRQKPPRSLRSFGLASVDPLAPPKPPM